MGRCKYFILVFLFFEVSYAIEDLCPKALDDNKRKALIISLLRGDEEKSLNLLSQPDVDVNARDEMGRTVLMIYLLILSPDAYDLDLIESLIVEEGADVNAQDNDDNTALHYNKSPYVASILIKENAKVNAQNKKRRTPLHNTNNQRTARILIEAGAKVDIEDENGNTPIHTTSDSGVAEVLVEFGANPHATNNDGVKSIFSYYFHLVEEYGQRGVMPLRH